MVSTFINPVVNPDRPLGVNAFTEPQIVCRLPEQSADELESVIQAVYRQVLGNAYVMESERSQVAESQFKRGELSVAEFIRSIAYSDLYRTRFFENGPRNRFIELNFKHFLGRAPQSRTEIAEHSKILDTEGYEAEIDAYLNSDEYEKAFGPDTVPYYRGYKTEGSTPTGFTHMFSLLRGASSSDKHVTTNNPARLAQSLLADKVSSVSSPSGATNRQGHAKDRDINDFLRDLFNKPAATATSQRPQAKPQSEPVTSRAYAPVAGSQDEKIAQLTAQLNELRSLANMGSAILRKGQMPAGSSSEGIFGSGASTQTIDKAKQIEKLQGELMSARSLANIAEARLNKWRQRSY
ncbi:MAG: phycobilisome rod-core linker polypeptide [Cyanobacteria bacterium J06555_13]